MRHLLLEVEHLHENNLIVLLQLLASIPHFLHELLIVL